MNRNAITATSKCRMQGFAFIEILLVLVVIAILMGWYFREGSPTEQAASQYQHSMDRSKSAACAAGRSAMRTSVQMYAMQNPGVAITKDGLAAANIRLDTICPEQGEITVASDGTLLCSKHP